MRLFDTDKINEIWTTISRNKVRSLLTGFGVFWGLFMLIVLISIGAGFRNSITNIISGFAVNTVEFYTYKTSEPYKGYKSGRWWRMDNRDIELIRQKCQSVEYVAPMIFGYASQGVVRGSKTGSFRYVGVTGDYFNIQNMNLHAGRLLRETDNEARRKVCIIGTEVYETLFDPGEDPLGQYIRINGIYFQVVGMVDRMSSGFGMDIERRILLPMQTMQNVFGRGIYFQNLICSTKKGYSSSAMQEEVSAILKAAHDISPTDTKALGGWNLEEMYNKFMNVVLGINILTWIVGMGALFSGVIGISNIMLVSIRERMREIGVRRALGARPGNIMGQIISESFVLTALAGLGGFLFGIGVVAILESTTSHNPDGGGLQFQPEISFGLAVSCFAILIAAGIFAGILPAYRALKIKAIDAIRDE